jgi:MFS family permease
MIRRVLDAARRVPANVRLLSWVSLANDAASEMLYPVLPLFLTVTLNAPVAVLGLVEGIAEAVAVLFRGVVGPLSDRGGGARRPWITAGYTASVAGRVLVAVAPAWGFVLGGRVVDRFGKALRSPPRDALIRDSTPPTLVGASFGFHRTMDSVGAVVGPLIAVGLVAGGADIRTVIEIAVLPGIATVVLLRFLREAPRVGAAAGGRTLRGSVAALPRPFWVAVVAWGLFALGNSSDTFLLIRGHDLGLSLTGTILTYVGFNVVYAALAWPLGSLSDRTGRRRLLVGGMLVYAAVYAGFALATAGWMAFPLFALYGVYLAATDGVAKALVADHAPADLSGTAYGVFAALTGACALAASTVAGVLYDTVGHGAPFALGTACSLLGAAAMMALPRR